MEANVTQGGLFYIYITVRLARIFDTPLRRVKNSLMRIRISCNFFIMMQCEGQVKIY